MESPTDSPADSMVAIEATEQGEQGEAPAFPGNSEGVVPAAQKAFTGADDPIIVLDNVVKKYGDKVILDNLYLEVPRGKVTVVMGGSGHGKSTILKLIVGFITPSVGRVIIDGANALELNPAQRLEVQKKIGMSFQYSALFDSMNVYENIAFPLREHTRLNEEEIRAKVSEVLEKLSLPGIEEKMPSDLSGGMKKRVGVARAIMLQPKIMLFDEPESGLDPITTTSIGELIMEMRDAFDISCLVISHHLENTMRIGDKVSMLYKGKIIAEGTPDDLKDDPDPILQQFLNGRSTGPY